MRMAVYTQVTDQEIQEFLHEYPLPTLMQAEGIRAGVENTNYKLTLVSGERLILTLFEKRVAEQDLPFFMEVMESIAQAGLPCPLPQHARHGGTVLRLKDKPAVLVSFLSGRSIQTIAPIHMEALGEAMARMHLAACDVRTHRANALGLQGWQQMFAMLELRLDQLKSGLSKELAHEIKMLAEHWPQHLPAGVIHADLFPDNVFFDEAGTLTGLIDFYFACNDLWIYDIAICLNAWCFEKNHEFNITRAKRMLRAYHAVRPLSEEELSALPLLARGAALRFLLTRAHDALFPASGALVTPKDPFEYYKKLRFHQSVTHHREYGL